jgi:hypothetical protein
LLSDFTKNNSGWKGKSKDDTAGQASFVELPVVEERICRALLEAEL